MKNQSLIEHANAERILEEGWRMFQQMGYRGVVIDELCQKCELSKPTLYYYFKDKENLFVQILQYKLHDFHLAADRVGSLGQHLQNVAGAILNSFQTEYSNLLRDREHIKDPKNREKIRDAFRSEFFEPLMKIMKSGIETGELRKENPELLTLIYLGIINNFIGKSAEMKTDPLSLAKQLTNIFLEGAKEK